MTVASLVIPSYQGADRLPILLGALARQVTDFEWEAIVVLDGSTDASDEILADWASAVPLRVVRLDPNQGRSAALNAGFEAAAGNILIRCDDDLEPSMDYVRRHVELHGDRDDIGVIGPYRNVRPATVFARHYGLDVDERLRRDAYTCAPERRWHLWAGNCSVSRAMYDAVGPYDTGFRKYGWEDIDWGYRLHVAGATLVVDPGVEAVHHVAATTTAIRSDRAELSGEAKARFLRKHSLADESQPSRGARDSIWNRCVAGLSRAPSGVRRGSARAIDRIGIILPSSIGRRLVALSVESAGLAGFRSSWDTPPASERPGSWAERPTTPGISIVIPHYGDPATTMSLLSDLTTGTSSLPMQLIVVDDASPTPFPARPGDVWTIIRRETNGGFGAAVNTGAERATHPLLLILNSDLRVGPTFVADLTEASGRWMPAIVAPRITGPDGRPTHSARRFPTIASSVLSSLTPLARWRETKSWHRAAGHEPPPAVDLDTVCDWLVGAVLLLPTEDFHRLGGFDERFHMNSEEVDLQRRAREHHLPSVAVGEVEVEHMGGGSSDPQLRTTWLRQGEWRYFEKWRGRRTAHRWLLAMRAVALVNLLWDGARMLAGRRVSPLRTWKITMATLRSASQPTITVSREPVH